MEETKVQTKIRKKPIPAFTEIGEPILLKSQEIKEEQVQPISIYEDLKKMGIPVKKVVFAKQILSWNGTPETHFYSPGLGNIDSRVANMWYTPHGLLCEQGPKQNKRIVPLGNVTYAELL